MSKFPYVEKCKRGLNGAVYKKGMLVKAKATFTAPAPKYQHVIRGKTYIIEDIKNYPNANGFVIKIKNRIYDPDYFSLPFGKENIGRLLYLED